jgi:sigma-B regulation protein RsbU (phosphoserine phosphatase)
LKLAEEVQQNLLPQKPPDFPGVDASGISHYCDQTGGDYYDFLMLPSNRLGVIVADAADHGVGSALHMTTARAFLKYGAHQYREPVDFVQQVNRHLTRDSVASGRFMTLFFLEIDSSAKVLRWIRAGHEPAYLYDPSSGKFTAMDGEGIALGIISDWSYLVYRQEGWHPGSIVVIGTDGIREARNLKGNMFGVERLQDAIAQNAARSAKEIQQAVIEQLRQFRQEARQEDDLTLVVVKLF